MTGAVVVLTSYSNIATPPHPPPITAVYSTTPAADSTGFRLPTLVVLLTRLEDHLPPPPELPLFPLAPPPSHPPEMFSFHNEHSDQFFGALWVPPTLSTPQDRRYGRVPAAHTAIYIYMLADRIHNW